MSSGYLWHVWPGRNRPATNEEETELIEALTLAAELSGSGELVARFERGEVTAVLNVLRCGMTWREVLDVAPGISAVKLLSAYRYLDFLRIRSQEHFVSLLDSPAPETMSTHASGAASLLPVPTYRIVAAIRNHPDRASEIAEQVRSFVKTACVKALEAEDRLAKVVAGYPDRRDAVDLGRELYDPYGSCLWSDAFYIPTRVGTLMPGRVADLIRDAES